MEGGRRRNTVTRGRCVYKTKIESMEGVGSGMKKRGIISKERVLNKEWRGDSEKIYDPETR